MQAKQGKTKLPRKKDRMKRNELIFIWLILTPMLIQYIATSIVPLVFSAVITFYDWSLLATRRFVGLANWQKLFSDRQVVNSLIITVKYALFQIVFSISGGLGLALLINRKKPGIGMFKAIFFLPVITSTVVITSVWRWFFTAESDGIVNSLLGIFGIKPQFFYGSDLALTTLAVLGIYKSVGLIMVYYFAGLKSIPGELYEAAKIDGASSTKCFLSITLPLLNSTTQYVLIIVTAGALKVFDSIYALWPTGSPQSVNTIIYHVYRVGFYDQRMGYGSTIGYLLFFIIFAISFVQYVVLDRQNKL